jgi:RimK family alpha-L-glutamate ligase
MASSGKIFYPNHLLSRKWDDFTLMALRLGILGNSGNWYVSDLLRAAQLESAEAVVFNFSELLAGLIPESMSPIGQNLFLHLGDGSQGSTFFRGQPRPNVDALLVRSMPPGSLEQVIFRMDCLRCWQAEGIRVVNSPYALETCIDKWLTLHRLYMQGLCVPQTIVCQTRGPAMEALERLGGDVLVKPLFGGEGRGIIRITDAELAWRTFSTLQQLGQAIYVQKFIPNSGYDIRVFVLGDQIFSIRRKARPGEYRSNISQGGMAEPHELTEGERGLAVQSARALGAEIVGVDLLPGDDGRLYVLEVNAVPGWRALGKTLGIDIGRGIIQRLAQIVNAGFSVSRPDTFANPMEMS